MRAGKSVMAEVREPGDGITVACVVPACGAAPGAERK